MPAIRGFDHIEDKYTLCRGKDCIKTFCESLRGHAKRKNFNVKKKRIRITRKCKGMFYFQKKIL